MTSSLNKSSGCLTSLITCQKSDNKPIILPLVEKYRPKLFTDILFDDFIKDKIKNILKSKQLPNKVITGEPSTGKTTTVLYMAKKIYKDDYDNNVYVLYS